MPTTLSQHESSKHESSKHELLTKVMHSSAMFWRTNQMLYDVTLDRQNRRVQTFLLLLLGSPSCARTKARTPVVNISSPLSFEANTPTRAHATFSTLLFSSSPLLFSTALHTPIPSLYRKKIDTIVTGCYYPSGEDP